MVKNFKNPVYCPKNESNFMRNIFLWSCCFCWYVTAAQQIAPTSIPLSTVEQITLPAIDNAALMAKEAQRRANREVPEFAVSVQVAITPTTHGHWEVLENGTAVWRVRIHSKGAHSLNLGFTNFQLPKDAVLFLYNPSQEHVIGPFSAADNEEHEQLWTPILPDETVVVELQVPAANRDQVQVNVGWVNHDFAGLGSIFSQNCHLDVNCGAESGFTELDNFRDIIQSVGMYSVNGVRLCTGVLMNNVRQDCTPYFLTAFHCEVSTNNAPSVVVYWNYENSTCRSINTPENARRGDGLLIDFNTGAKLVAAKESSDMTLLQLDDDVSIKADAFFAGWSNENVTPNNTICIHHPNTEEKRISFSNQPTYTGLWRTDNDFMEGGNHLIVPSWDIGSTEGGSSGGPLFDTNKRVIGQLHGGSAQCGNRQYDSFGRLFSSWTDSDNAPYQLKNWLDPDGLGLTRLDGRYQKDCGKVVVPTAYVALACNADNVLYQVVLREGFQGNVGLSTTGLPEGVQVAFSKNPAAANDTIIITLSALQTYENSILTWNLVTEDSLGVYPVTLQLQVLGNEVQTSILQLPANNNPVVSDNALFTWENEGLGLLYQFQLATDSAFEQLVVDTVGLSSSNFQLLQLSSGKPYFWRVKAFNLCGEGNWSEVRTFITADCRRYLSTQVPVTIRTGPAGDYTAQLNIPLQGSITDVDVVPLSGRHTWVSDLAFKLVSPNATTVELVNRPCFDEDNFNFVFDDDALLPIPCPPTDGLPHSPLTPLRVLNGENMEGTWQLRFSDSEDQDGGRLDAWGLKVCSVSDIFDVSVQVSENEFLICKENDLFLNLKWGDAFHADSIKVQLERLPANLRTNIVINDTSRTAAVEIRGLQNLANGTYTFLVSVADAQFSNTSRVIVNKLALPTRTNLLLPTDKAENVKAPAKFEWQAVPNTSDYLLELALDSTFTSIVESQLTTKNTYTKRDTFLQDTTYFWRVITRNSCKSDTSAVFKFETGRLVGTINLSDTYFSVFPNPTTGKLTIVVNESTLVPTAISFSTIDGKPIRRLSSYSDHIELDVSEVPAGIYLLQIVTPEGMIWRKIAVE